MARKSWPERQKATRDRNKRLRAGTVHPYLDQPMNHLFGAAPVGKRHKLAALRHDAEATRGPGVSVDWRGRPAGMPPDVEDDW